MGGFPTRANSNVPSEALSAPEASPVTCLHEAGSLGFAKVETCQFAFTGADDEHLYNPDHTSRALSVAPRRPSGTTERRRDGSTDSTFGVASGTYLDQIREEGIEAFDPTARRSKRLITSSVKSTCSTTSRGPTTTGRHRVVVRTNWDGYSDKLSDRIAEGREVTVKVLARARMY